MQPAALELQGVGKSFGLWKKKRALGGVSLRVERGECFGLAGVNGAGKTTLIRIMLGLIDPDEGDAFLFGVPPDEPEVRRRVGFVPESAQLPESASPRALVKRWARLRGLPAAKTLAEGLQTLERLGMRELFDRPSGKLSKGERQRTLLALAMLGSPELLILDEPTDGLDPLGRARMREVIRSECDQGRTVFLNSHLLGESERICDRVGILHRGQLVRVQPLARARQQNFPHASAIVLSTALTAEQLARAQVQAVPQEENQLRDLLPSGPTVLVQHEDLHALNGAIDRLRAEGALLVEVRPIQPDLEAALVAIAGSTPASANISPKIINNNSYVNYTENSLESNRTNASKESPTIYTAPVHPSNESLQIVDISNRPRVSLLRALIATFRVAQEIASDLSSRRLGWVALGAALFATAVFIAIVHSEMAMGAAAFAHTFGAGNLSEPKEVGAYLGGWTARLFFWPMLVGGVLLAAVFIASLLEPRRTLLLYSQPISRADYALGIWTATGVLALMTAAFISLLAFVSMRWLAIEVPWTLLLTPLIWALAFASILALQILFAIVFRSAIFISIVGLAIVWGSGALARFSLLESHSLRGRLFGFLFALLPRTVQLVEQSARIAEGKSPRLLGVLPTIALVCAYLLLVRVAARRSET